uniref:Uncharacterized protein n=1 Tax=Sphaerodactylus townsendi TaxID=933632 RepID=A0ACB8F7D3_9SAUR
MLAALGDRSAAEVAVASVAARNQSSEATPALGEGRAVAPAVGLCAESHYSKVPHIPRIRRPWREDALKVRANPCSPPPARLRHHLIHQSSSFSQTFRLHSFLCLGRSHGCPSQPLPATISMPIALKDWARTASGHTVG